MGDICCHSHSRYKGFSSNHILQANLVWALRNSWTTFRCNGLVKIQVRNCTFILDQACGSVDRTTPYRTLFRWRISSINTVNIGLNATIVHWYWKVEKLLHGKDYLPIQSYILPADQELNIVFPVGECLSSDEQASQWVTVPVSDEDGLPIYTYSEVRIVTPSGLRESAA